MRWSSQEIKAKRLGPTYKAPSGTPQNAGSNVSKDENHASHRFTKKQNPGTKNGRTEEYMKAEKKPEAAGVLASKHPLHASGPYLSRFQAFYPSRKHTAAKKQDEKAKQDQND